MKSDFLSNTTNLIVAGVVVLGLFVLMQSSSKREPLQIEPASDAWFQSEVVNAPGLVFVKFGAEWCGPCKSTDRALDEYKKSVADPIKIVQVDVDKHNALAAHYRVSSIPHSFVFSQGRIVDDHLGGMDAKGIENWVKQATQKWTSDSRNALSN